MVSAEHIDYIEQGYGAADTIEVGNPVLQPGDGNRHIWHIPRIARLSKQFDKGLSDVARLPSQDVLTALHGHSIPTVHLLQGSPQGVEIGWGTWQVSPPQHSPTLSGTEMQDLLRAALRSLYGQVVTCSRPMHLPTFPMSGLVVGKPSPEPPGESDGALQVDRLIRSMVGERWAVLILAVPLDSAETSRLRNNVVEEMRRVQQAMDNKRVSIPLAKHYLDLLAIEMQHLTLGVALGSWRVGTYLLGDRKSYPMLASLWRGIFSGDQSLPQTLRVVAGPDGLRELAERWALPERVGDSGPGYFRHPWAYQSVLNSSQLAVYTEFPRLETSGFAIDFLPSFDAVPHQSGVKEGIGIGQIILQGQESEVGYRIQLRDLTRHMFVTGVTGSGKTNTIFHLLNQVAGDSIPYLVIEPAKKEYRALTNNEKVSSKLQLFTLGNEQVLPFRMNPFEVLPDTPVAVHLDLLRSVFAASFGMWTPLPQILEMCLHAIYRDRGWNIASNRNRRLTKGASRASAFPTLTDLALKIDEVTRGLGYEDRVTSDLRAALLTRVNSLRTGAKGRMLDVERSVPMEKLLQSPAVLELEGIGDDDDKAFVMGLLLIRLVSYRRSMPPTQELRHLLIIEEAHRLLTQVSTEFRTEEANPRGKAVETFSQLLSEIRAYGQGVIIADQVPVKLAPDVIKNTNLKIVHRIVAADDRAVIAGAMAMNENQEHALAILKQGQAVAFSEGDDSPILVKVPLAILETYAPTDEELIEGIPPPSTQSAGESSFPSKINDVCGDDSDLRDLAYSIVEDAGFQRTFARIVLSTVEERGATSRLRSDLLVRVQPHRPHWAEESIFLRCIIGSAADWFARHRGAQNAWSYEDQEEFAALLRKVLQGLISDDGAVDSYDDFRAFARNLNRRSFDPYPACSRICRQDPPVCLYRRAAADLIASERFKLAWMEGEKQDRESGGGGVSQTWEVCMDAGYELIEFAGSSFPDHLRKQNHAAARRASLCFAQQMLASDPSKTPATAVRIIDSLIQEANHE